MVPNMSFKSLRQNLDKIFKQEGKQIKNQRKNWFESNFANFHLQGGLKYVGEIF